MSPLAGKRVHEDGDFENHGSATNFKNPNASPNSVSNYPVQYGGLTTKNAPLFKRRRVSAVRDFPKNCGPFASKIDGGKIEGAVVMEMPQVSNTDKCYSENSVASNGENDVTGSKIAFADENKFVFLGGKLNRELVVEKLHELIAQAKAFISLFEGKKSTSNISTDVLVLKETKSLIETVKTGDKRACDETSAEHIVGKKLNENLAAEIVEVVGVIQEKESAELEVECNDIKGVLDSENSNENSQEEESMDLDECEFEHEKEKDEPMEKSPMDDDDLAIVRYSVTDEPKYDQKLEELINLSTLLDDKNRALKVREALDTFQEYFTQLQENGSKYAHIEASERLKSEGTWVPVHKPFGHVPGVEIGHTFGFRAELAVIGLHRQYINGIDYVVLGDKKFATSVINSGCYVNEFKTLDSLIYSGQGWVRRRGTKPEDQKLEKGNLAMVNSMEMRYPVRVMYKLSGRKDTIYVYDGLFTIEKSWRERGKNGKLVFKFELHRMPGQSRTHQRVATNLRKSLPSEKGRNGNDISQGKENFPIRGVNEIDEDRPQPFTYTTNIIYPKWYHPIEPVGCDCIDGCSDFHPCPCVVKNGGEIPFNQRGAIVRAKPTVHECGPSCKCPPTCKNRVTQNGPRYQLEIFKTKSRGWGVRSRNSIPSGNFICEYIGEMLSDKEAEQRIGHDEYLFDITDSHDENVKGEIESFVDSRSIGDGFVIDAAKFGNIGRFVNHSCSPNLYAQEVLYDHEDKRMPHIMFFATKTIPSLEEITYDYNYKMDQICDGSGSVKTKSCYCGSPECTGRMY